MMLNDFLNSCCIMSKDGYNKVCKLIHKGIERRKHFMIKTEKIKQAKLLTKLIN